MLWSQETTESFLKNLEEFVCTTSIIPENMNCVVEKAFGYPVNDKFPLYWYDTERQEFSGISFRYIMDTINPDDISKNFAEIADNLEFNP